MRPAPVANCRVLEIGCGDGGNVVPLAYGLPEGQVTGVDLATDAISSARRMAADLKLENIRLVAGDLREIGPDYGEFDCIIAHGVYSWVPADARDALLRVCAARLAPQGVAFVSYNTYPGRHVRQMLREMMLYQTRSTADPARRMERARSFLHALAEGRLAPPAWRGLLEEETRLLLEKDASSFWHDDLAEVNDPVYFHEFARHAAAHGLQYLGEADAHLMFDPRGASSEADDPIEREQELDFLRCRRFRQTLLCRSEVILDRDPGAARMARFLFAAPARRLAGGEIEGLNGIRIAPGHAELEGIVGALGDSYPLPLPFDDLLPYGSGPDELAEILWALARSGFATFHVHDFPCEETVTARPRASALARWQAARSSQVLSACHTPVELEEADLRLLRLLDGSRDQEELARACGFVPDEALTWFARMGLLEG
jgi:SAM-dependent methyltransferase